MKIRPYISTDKSAVIELLQLNTPTFFDKSEQKDLEHYLNNEIEDYFVIEYNNAIIGAGGINYFLSENKARIAWDFIHPNHQGKGIGRLLTQHRLNHLMSYPEVHNIIVRTSQHVYKFYEKLNFKIVIVKPNFWAVGYDLYEMEQTNTLV
jgi:ribosomal protein S18 acetylase RimI-like enzyme